MLAVPLLPRTAPLDDPTVFESVYQRHHRQIFRYAMALCGGCASDAEDITAETFLRAWRGRRCFAGADDQVFGWLLTIARHTLIDRQRRDTIDRISATLDDDVVDLSQPLDEIVVRHDDLQTILAAMASLPFHQRDIILLRYLMDWKVKTIAQHLAISENAASVTLHRAMKRLRSILHAAKESAHDQ